MFDSLVRGYLPENYYKASLVYRHKPPRLRHCRYPNKIEVDAQRNYAIVVGAPHAQLQALYTWMNTHPYIRVNCVAHDAPTLTGNIAVEAYEDPTRSYAMVVFRAATHADEQTDCMMRARGQSTRRAQPCPAPVTGLLCRTGVNLCSVWQWLSLHRGKLANLVEAAFLRGTVAVPARVRRSPSSRASVDSALPAYEPPPPSVHSSEMALIAESESESESSGASDRLEFVSEPPPYWQVAAQTAYGRACAASDESEPEVSAVPRAAGAGPIAEFSRSLPALNEIDATQSAPRAVEVVQPLPTTDRFQSRRPRQSRVRPANVLRRLNYHVRRGKLSAKTNPVEYSSKRNWISRLLNM